jgi:hypothetical protein
MFECSRQLTKSLLENIENEKEISRRIDMLPKSKSDLPYREKREIVLNELHNSKNYKEIQIDLQNNTIILIDIKQLREERNARINQKISEIKDASLTNEQKLLKVLDELNSSESFECVQSEEVKEPKESEIIEPPMKWILEEEKKSKIYTKYIVHSMQDISNDSTNDISSEKQGSQVSDPMAEKWIKNKLYDSTSLFENLDKQGDKQESFSNKYMAYEYPNDLKTYNVSISQFLISNYKLGKISSKVIDQKDYDSKLGLYFCGKDIKEFGKKCSPNEMMCKDCMKKNKEIYHLDHKSLSININGRICSSAFKDKKFHCCGKFRFGKTVRNCINDDFTCKACKELNQNFEYYNQ